MSDEEPFRLDDPEAQFRRGRRTLVAVLAMLILVPAVLLARQLLDGGDRGNEPQPESALRADDATAPAKDPQATRRIDDRKAGIRVDLPPGWRHERRAGAHVLSSSDGCVTVALSDPGAAGQAKRIRADAIAALAKSLGRGAKVIRGADRRVGGLKSSGAVASVKVEGERRSALVAVGAGRDRAYLTQVTSRSARCAAALAEGQQLLASARFTG